MQLQVKCTVTALSLAAFAAHEQLFVNYVPLQSKFQDVQLQGWKNSINFSVQADKATLMPNAAKYLQEGFLKTEHKIEMCTRVIDTFIKQQGKKLDNFKEKEIETLAQHFKNKLGDCIIDLEKAKQSLCII